MWLLGLLSIGTCIYSGASLDHYDANLSSRYPPENNNRYPKQTADSFSNVIIDDYGNGYAHIRKPHGGQNGRNAKYVCPADFVRSGNSCYYLSATMETWQDAHFDCKDRGADLARMEKKWEDRNMRIYLNTPELAPLERWIGGIYDWKLKRWVWGATARNLGYQGFSRRRPNTDNQWHCIVMDPAMMYRWGARSCIERKHFICEKRLKDMKPRLPEEVLRRRKAKWRRMNRKLNKTKNNRKSNTDNNTTVQ